MQTATTTADASPWWQRHGVWNIDRLEAALRSEGQSVSTRTVQRWVEGIAPPVLNLSALRDEHGRTLNGLVAEWLLGEARARRHKVLLVQLAPLPDGCTALWGNDARGERWWVRLEDKGELATAAIAALTALQHTVGKELFVLPHGELVAALRAGSVPAGVRWAQEAYRPVLSSEYFQPRRRAALSAHLRELEEESLYFLREAIAEAANPVVLYSIGKDSTVLLHLLRKAFYPAPPPVPLLHIDTRWKFQEMYLFRDAIARAWGFELIVYTNPEAVRRDINPFDHGSALHTHITKTEALKQALAQHRFDMVIGGARRDEEKSRAKERIFSLRNAAQQWDPKAQRPELWRVFNTRLAPGQSLRVFPLSNWTERDVWHYILAEGLPVVPLYFAKPRPTVARDGAIFVVDDERFRLLPGEEIRLRWVRFRTLGCYPLTAAVESRAQTLEEIVAELERANTSERQGRKIDSDEPAAMERKKREGYF